jgi:ubiquinone/menaquinone biosynthesis C-methylase UbiE
MEPTSKNYQDFVPALRWNVLTILYDFILHISGLGKSFKESITNLSLNGTVPHTILDVGCGTGTHLKILRQRFPNATIHGVDPDCMLLKNINARTDSLTLSCASATQLPFEADIFDTCFSTLTFHHLPQIQKQQAFEEIYRVLKPGGLFVLTDWGVSRIPHMEWFLIFEKNELIRDHFLGKISEYAEAAGFVLESTVRVKPTGIWMWKFKKQLAGSPGTI